MVILEPPRSRMLSKHREEELRRRQHNNNNNNNNSNNSTSAHAAPTGTNTDIGADPSLSSFRTTVDNYVSYYKGIARGAVSRVGHIDLHAASQGKLPNSTYGREPNVAVVRPSSASVVSLSRDAPFYNQYTVSDVVRRSSGTCGVTAEVTARASEARAVNRRVIGGREEQENDEVERLISPVTGLTKSFYKEAAVYAEARERLSSGKLGAPPCPSAAFLTQRMSENGPHSLLHEPGNEGKGVNVSAREQSKGISPFSVSPPRPISSCDFASTALGKIKQQLCSEADETFRHLQRAMRQRLRQHHHHDNMSARRHDAAQSSQEDEDHMLPLLVEVITNESMRSANEQQKTVVESSASSLGLPLVGCLPPAVDFSSFAESNALLEFIGGSRCGQSGMSSFQLSKLNESERLAVDVLGPQLRRGFSHRGLDIADELPIAISFPTYDNLAASSADGKRPITDKRYNVHSRCVLVGALVVPSRTRARQGSANGRTTTIAKTTTLPILATTLTAETHFGQLKRREARERIKAQKAMQLLDVKASSACAETRAEAAIEAAKRLSVVEAELSRPKTDEAILEEVLLARRGYRVADEVIAAVEEKMRNEAKPLRQMREVKRVPIPEFIEYADCRVRPLFLACYEVPNNRIDAPTRSSLDPAVMMTTKASMYDDLYPFEKLEFTMRWGTPIRFMGPEELAKDCWVRKVVRFPVFAESSPSPSTCTSPSVSPRRPFSARSTTGEASSHAGAKGSVPAEEVPLGVLLQACGRGAVSIDVEGRSVPGAAIPPLFYRHSFLFAERGVAAIMRERRYGKNSRHVSTGYSVK